MKNLANKMNNYLMIYLLIVCGAGCSNSSQKDESQSTFLISGISNLASSFPNGLYVHARGSNDQVTINRLDINNEMTFPSGSWKFSIFGFGGNYSDLSTIKCGVTPMLDIKLPEVEINIAMNSTNCSSVSYLPGALKEVVSSIIGNKGPIRVDLLYDNGIEDVKVKDINGDGHLDIITVNSSTDKVEIRYGYLNGYFTKPTVITHSKIDYPEGIEVADFDNDSLPDLIISSRFYGAGLVFRNKGDGTFNFVHELKEGATPKIRDCKAADLDNNGQLDLICADYNNGKTYIRTFETDRTEKSFISLNHTIPYKPRSIAIADMNNNGALDIVVGVQKTGSNDSQIEVSLNDGAGNFSAFSVAAATPYSSHLNKVLVTDLENDGYNDIITSLTTTGETRMYTGNGSGTTFSYLTVVGGGGGGGRNGTHGSAYLDLDHDGNQDLVSLDYTNNILYVDYSDTGPLTFTNAKAIPVGNNPGSFALGDFDKDGRLDAVVGSKSSGGISIVFNLED